MKDKLYLLVEVIIKFILIIIIESMFIFAPFYIAFVMRYSQKARKVVYGYWYNNDTNRFVSYYNFKIANIKNNFIENGLAAFRVETTSGVTETIYISTEEEVNRYNTKNIFKLLFLDMRYHFYYMFIWSWLDDPTNVNGIDTSVLDPFSPKYVDIYNARINHKQFLRGTNNAVFTSVFDKEYIKSNNPLFPFMTRLWFIKFQYLNNILRDLYTIDTIHNKTIFYKTGYVYSPKYRRVCLTILGYNVFDKE